MFPSFDYRASNQIISVFTSFGLSMGAQFAYYLTTPCSKFI